MSRHIIETLNRKDQAVENYCRVLEGYGLGDCASRTVAGVPSGLSPCGSQAKPLINYRKKEGANDLA